VLPRIGCFERETRVAPLGRPRPCPRSGGQGSESPAAKRARAHSDFLDGDGVVVECTFDTSSGETGSYPRPELAARPRGTPVLQPPPVAPLRPAIRGRGASPDRPPPRKSRACARASAGTRSNSPSEAPRAAARCREAGNASGGHLPDLRVVLRPGLAGVAVRVGLPHRCPERSVPGAVPDGVERTPHLRTRRIGRGAGEGRAPLFRRVRK
jgi:hypothetical protein